ncbi:MAG: tetraacyldisaccharide 4'-kinase [bacterium TMED88]|nr:tetraacyldisaccharide 4'-kinase [Deltaproteobacteria bacterium]OUV35710.1 MAG: tetraacyldisaccharide 4'-kinase [bacterium TMED88]
MRGLLRRSAWPPRTRNRPLNVVLSGLSKIYGPLARIHRGLWSSGIRTPRRLDCCVISIGSPVVGGAGKTPTAAWLARALQSRGYRVALATRGYGGRSRRGVQLVDWKARRVASADQVGDEALILSHHAPDVPVWVARDRGLAGLRAISTGGAQVLVLDDGLSHHRLFRDLHIVSLDAGAGLGNRKVLPLGPLREPLEAIAAVEAVGVVDGVLKTADEQEIARWTPDAFRYQAVRRPVAVRGLKRNSLESPASLNGARVGILCGLGCPAAFERTLLNLGAEIVARRFFPDHHAYVKSDLVGLSEQASLWLTTEKDAVKIMPSWVQDFELRVLEIELTVVESEAFLDWLEGRIHSVRGLAGGSA